MQTIPISEFKAKCLGLLQKVNEENEVLIVTRHGKPVAEVRPCPKDLEVALQRFRGSVTYAGDLISPLDEKWEADR
jgi:prevent-host-death family protein